MRRLSMIFLLLLLAGFATASDAGQVRVYGHVTRTLVADGARWGGCMVFLDQTLANWGLDCPSQWASFSCSGDFTAKDIAYRMFDQAQMAYVTGDRVMLMVDDTKKHNGYCYANRIDVLK